MGGVSSGPIFCYLFFVLKKNMSLNPLKLPKNPSKTNFFSSIFGRGTLLSYDSSHMGSSNFKPVQSILNIFVLFLAFFVREKIIIFMDGSLTSGQTPAPPLDVLSGTLLFAPNPTIHPESLVPG